LINRFNFYDVYGYFLPGLMFLIMLGLPIVLVTGRAPQGDLASAVLAIGLAYVAGHILQTLAITAFPSSIKVGRGRRFPSDMILDQDNLLFSPAFKAKVAAKIRDSYGLDVTAESNQRHDAFFVCRSALIKGSTVCYGEQFEGMYSLMRGLMMAFLLGAAHNSGWALASFPGFGRSAVLALEVGLLGGILSELAVELFSKPGAKRLLALVSVLMVAIALLAGGYLLAGERAITPRLYHLFALTALTSIFFARKCFRSYKFFTWEFAKAVYRDFLTYEKPHHPDKAETVPTDSTPDP